MGNMTSSGNTDKTGDPNTTLPDPSVPMLFFFIATSIYCAISLFITDTGMRRIHKAIYILFVVVGEYFINLNLSEIMCGVRQWNTTFMITVIPWLIIFGVLQVILVIFPGWLAPFSNTFGYLAVKLMGLPDVMKDILVNGTGKEEGEIARALENVRSDSSLLINQFFTESSIDNPDPKTNSTVKKVRVKFDAAWEQLVKGSIVKKDADAFKDKIYGFVQMKYTVAEYVWNLLAGFFVTSVSYNYILNSACAKSPEEMKKRHDAYEESQRKKELDKKKKEEKSPDYKQIP
jgi:hypothetical protein